MKSTRLAVRINATRVERNRAIFRGGRIRGLPLGHYRRDSYPMHLANRWVSGKSAYSRNYPTMNTAEKIAASTLDHLLLQSAERWLAWLLAAAVVFFLFYQLGGAPLYEPD